MAGEDQVASEGLNIEVDADDEVWDSSKANWDDSSAEEGSGEGEEYAALREKKKGAKVSKIDKLAKKRTERAAAGAADDETEVTAEERLRRQKMVEASDLENVLDAFAGVAAAEPKIGSLDSAAPLTESEFTAFCDRLMEKIEQFEDSPHFPGFAEQLIRAVGAKLEHDTARKAAHALSALATEKAKTKKKPTKKKTGKQLTITRDGSSTKDFLEDASITKGGDFDADNDFM